jgi:hypothetical protein
MDMEGYVPLKQMAKLLVIGLGVAAFLDLVEIGLYFDQLNLLQRAANGLVNEGEAEASDLRVQIVAVLGFGLLLINAYLFVTWMKRAHRNLYAFGVYSHISESYVRWAFFIPFVNLVRPYRVMKAVWDGSIPVGSGSLGRSSQILTLWWAAWIMSGFAERAAGSMAKGSSISSLQTATSLGIVATLIHLAAAVLAILSIQAITARQESCASGQVAEEFD